MSIDQYNSVPHTTHISRDNLGTANPMDRINKERKHFLSLYMATVKNQTPDNPVDSSQMFNMITSLTQTEQAIQTNKLLQEMLNSHNKYGILQASKFHGKKVEFDDSVRNFEGRPIKFNYKLGNMKLSNIPEDAVITTNISILDNKNKVIYKTKGKHSEGQHSFIWNGIDEKGLEVPQGEYRIKVNSYYCSSSNDGITIPLESSTNISGIVDSIESCGDDLKLVINQQKISPHMIRKLLPLHTSEALKDYS